MRPIRLFAWLLTVVALTMPPAMAQPVPAMQGEQASMHCADHVPPPTPCPDHDTAKHATGTCCPAMTAASALLPATVAAARRAASPSDRFSTAVASLTGFSRATEPPPPRS